MKKNYLFAAMAAMMAACSENDLSKEQTALQNAEPGAVIFDVYTQRSTTRAGVPGEITTNGLKGDGDLNKAGFGVFAYYTNNGEYDNLQIPNFMYNQQVTWKNDGSGSAWIYTPLKYWPNEYGNTANSEDADKVSFFAYAPWINVVPTTGKPDGDANLQKWGINSISRNSATGDPIVKYLVDFDPSHSVDLCWGVNDGSVWNKVVDGNKQDFTIGLPWLNVQRPADAVSQKLKFTFKHALSKLNVQIDAFVDGDNNEKAIDASTRVYVRSITFEGLATKGALNLNNETENVAKWMDYNGTNDLVTGEAVTIYDGRKDGKEGTLGGEATNEKVLGLNAALVQTKVWKDDTNPGVTNVPVNLFRKSDGGDPLAYTGAALIDPIYVIPTGDPVKVTIIYDIETIDKSLATYVSDGQTSGSSIENVISKSISFGVDNSGSTVTKLENGKAYTLKLHLGMNSVKFDAAVTDWEVTAANDVDLPSNLPTYAASATPYEISVPSDAATFNYAITGLKAESAVSGTKADAGSGEVDNFSDYTTSTTANASGIAKVQVTLLENLLPKTVTNCAVTWQDPATNKVTLTIKQQPHALGLKATAMSPANGTITLQTDAKVNWGASGDIAEFVVKRNGITLKNPDDYSYDTSNGKITLVAELNLGDVYTITVKAGEAPAETITVCVGGISYIPDVTTKYVGETFVHPLTQYGYFDVNYSVKSGDESLAEVNSTTGIVTAKAEGTTAITASIANETGFGWFYPTKFKTKKYTLNIVKRPATISFPVSSVTINNVTTTAPFAESKTAVLKDLEGNDITSETAKAGTIAYSITDANFNIDEDSGVLNAKKDTEAGEYNVVVTATVTSGTHYDYDLPTATYTAKVKVTAKVTEP